MIPLDAIVDLSGKRGLVADVANDHSIAAGCAAAFRQAGAELAITCLSERARPFVQPVAEGLVRQFLCPATCASQDNWERSSIPSTRTGSGSISCCTRSRFAPRKDLHTSVVNCSAEGSRWRWTCRAPFIRTAKLAVPLMKEGGCLLTVRFYGADRVVENYNLMGPVKAALESSVRYLAAELADRRIRAHAISPGPIKTRAASGIDRFDELLDEIRARPPAGRLMTIEDVGQVAAFLASGAGAPLSGSVIYADDGFHTVA